MNPITAKPSNRAVMGMPQAPAAAVQVKKQFGDMGEKLSRAGRAGDKPKIETLLGKDPIEHNRDELKRATEMVDKIINGKNMNRAQVVQSLAEIQLTAEQGGNVVQEVTEALLATFDYLDEECSEISKAVTKVRKDFVFGDEKIIDILEDSGLKMRAGEGFFQRGLFKIKDKVVNVMPYIINALLMKSATAHFDSRGLPHDVPVEAYKVTAGVVACDIRIRPLFGVNASNAIVPILNFVETKGEKGVYTYTSTTAALAVVYAMPVIESHVRFTLQSLKAAVVLLVANMNIKYFSGMVAALGVELGSAQTILGVNPFTEGIAALRDAGASDSLADHEALLKGLGWLTPDVSVST